MIYNIEMHVKVKSTYHLCRARLISHDAATSTSKIAGASRYNGLKRMADTLIAANENDSTDYLLASTPPHRVQSIRHPSAG